ncbi:MAG: DUF4277 domain-containing protein, partial [Hormoscilla sp. GM102CHS1]|nr:DUF4277 domain-containing protein [Hormoscilla sp. GM102CHS1]
MKITNLDHLGLVAGIIDEIGIESIINRRLATSFHVHGEYKSSEENEVGEPRAIKITHGYSRDHRPDLKQFTMELICSGDGELPLWMKMGDGNQSDQKQFAQTIKEFKKTFEFS